MKTFTMACGSEQANVSYLADNLRCEPLFQFITATLNVMAMKISKTDGFILPGGKKLKNPYYSCEAVS